MCKMVLVIRIKGTITQIDKFYLYAIIKFGRLAVTKPILSFEKQMYLGEEADHIYGILMISPEEKDYTNLKEFYKNIKKNHINVIATLLRYMGNTIEMT